jgi:mitochondrial fission protein ELM1
LDVVWYSQTPRKVTKAFLGLADRVFVTMDSLTMITEAVASGRPTVALCPADLPKGNANTHLQYVRNLAADGLISLVRPGRDEGAPPVLGTTSEIDYSDAIHELTTRLRWNA